MNRCVLLIALAASFCRARAPVCFVFHVPSFYKAHHVALPFSHIQKYRGPEDILIVPVHGPGYNASAAARICRQTERCLTWHTSAAMLKSKPQGHRYSSLNQQLPYGEPHLLLAQTYANAAALCPHDFFVNVEPDCFMHAPLDGALLGDYVAHILEINTLPMQWTDALLPATRGRQFFYSFTCGTIYSRNAANCAFSVHTVATLLDASFQVYAQDQFVTLLLLLCGHTIRESSHVGEHIPFPDAHHAFLHGDKRHYTLHN